MLYTNFRVSAKSTPKLAQGYFGTLAPISAQVFCADFCANLDWRPDRNGHQFRSYREHWARWARHLGAIILTLTGIFGSFEPKVWARRESRIIEPTVWARSFDWSIVEGSFGLVNKPARR